MILTYRFLRMDVPDGAGGSSASLPQKMQCRSQEMPPVEEPKPLRNTTFLVVCPLVISVTYSPGMEHGFHSA